MFGGRYIQSDLAGVSLVRCRWRLGFTRWDAYWRNLANTIKPSMCGGDAVLSNYFDHLLLLLGRIAVLRMQMRPTVTDGVA